MGVEPAELHHDVLRRDVHAKVVLGEEVVLDGRRVGHHEVDTVGLAREENNKSVYILYLSKEGPISIRPFNFLKTWFHLMVVGVAALVCTIRNL